MWGWWWRLLGAPPCILHTVIVNLKDDPTTALQGVLWSAHGPWFTLRHASILKSGDAPTAADGELIIHRTHVAFFQVVEP
jgi:hypothetical protein